MNTTELGTGINVAVTAVTKTYETKQGPLDALRKVTLNLAAGEFVAVVGPSGCGKSTLLRLVAGLDRPTSGEIRIDGKAIDGPDPRHGVVFQRPALFPWLDVLGNVTFGPRMKARAPNKKTLVAEAERYITAVGLAGFERHKIYELSGGMMHRVALARVLINEPLVLLMDEPFGALDAQTRLVMQELLTEIWQAERSTVLFVTHDVDEALLLSDRTVVMTARPGQIKEIHDVTLPRPRGLTTLTTPEFASLKREVLGSIREETQRTMSLERAEVRAHSGDDR